MIACYIVGAIHLHKAFADGKATEWHLARAAIGVAFLLMGEILRWAT